MSIRGGLKPWLPVILYAALIFSISSLPGSCVPQLFPNADKLIHFLEYLPFGLLMVRAFARTASWRTPGLFAAALIAVLLYAFSDETHQLFVPGRQFDFLDMFSDMVGATVGTIIYLRWQKSNLS